MTSYKFSPGDSASISLDAATSGTGRAIAFNDCRQTNWLVEGIGTISSGTVIIESAHAQDYSGTWNELDNVDASTLSGGKLYGNTFPHVPGGFVRGRIPGGATIAGGGQITIRLNGLLG
jgi:hypothetical protein